MAMTGEILHRMATHRRRAAPGAWRAKAKVLLTLGRPHTASLTIPGTLLGPLLAGATDPWLYLLLGVWALGFHYFGFMDNNLLDLPHDRRDPSKAHFPLVSGAIPEQAARRLWVGGTLAFYAMGLAMLVAWPLRAGLLPQALFGAAWMHVAILFGMAYNRASKRWKGAPVHISLSFAALPLFGYFLAGGAALAAPIWYVFAFGFVLMFHQIAYSGYLKDLGPDPVNWLRSWGARAEPLRGAGGKGGDGGEGGEGGEEGLHAYVFPRKVQAWGWGSRLACPLLAWPYALLTGQDPLLSLAPMALFTLGLVVVFARLAKPGVFPRQRKVALMGASEVLAYFLLVASLHSFLGPLLSVAFYAGPLAWFVAWNKLLWGTLVGPRV